MTWERLESYKYPVLTLPTEIMSQIFIHFIPVYPSCPPVTGTNSPSFLMRICRHWRDIALSTPQLWRAIRLGLPVEVTPESQLEMAKAWLVRSGSCSLSIDMETVPLYMLEPELVEAILPYHSRWEYIKLNISSSDLLHDVGSLPMVRQLDLRFRRDSTAFPVPAIDAPRLRTAILWQFKYPSKFLPWHQLTSLTLEAMQPHECTPILKQTVNLIHCVLGIFGDNANQPDTALLRLESLLFKHFTQLLSSTLPVTGYLETFIVPSLRRLQVPCRFLQPDSLGKLALFIAKSGCMLQELCISDVKYISQEEVYRYREEFPSIKILFK
ncbi:hypothetical protein GGX14DRAFT_378565 [Mycena pura]|uniref:F-box domain-containing protein n=1 Tax=Mycena pura TaxID=153505 RepID=A0AAD6Y0S4_9AGAR|nr:hypothetical protein GGX14DRAFT_378565 [Mycena pura]